LLFFVPDNAGDPFQIGVDGEVVAVQLVVFVEVQARSVEPPLGIDSGVAVNVRVGAGAAELTFTVVYDSQSLLPPIQHLKYNCPDPFVRP
jgi:hypothetical protein